ncbi:hypothetical protein WICMUC_000410 [Wickerhamomyces mucosus]|uniref:Uncharacterized protein n=1 Tax=Wickerhamomyces mucosus TaxID=1378264 RepID=A0A9P8TI18_9ASCO|nr:hypothetical protein WICMUC_000410 [Wickerhamomyces mucosus]
MSVKEAAKNLVKALEAFPKEKLTDLSFKEVQLNRFRPLAGLNNPEVINKTSISDIVAQVNPYKIKELEIKADESSITEESIIQQIKALKNLKDNKYRDYYYVTDKLLRPQGNSTYYERLLADINGESKENLYTGLKTVLLDSSSFALTSVSTSVSTSVFATDSSFLDSSVDNSDSSITLKEANFCLNFSNLPPAFASTASKSALCGFHNGLFL